MFANCLKVQTKFKKKNTQLDRNMRNRGRKREREIERKIHEFM